MTSAPIPANTAPCPVCKRPPTIDEFKTGWSIACVGDRHCVQLFKGRSPEEVHRAWQKAFQQAEAST